MTILGDPQGLLNRLEQCLPKIEKLPVCAEFARSSDGSLYCMTCGWPGTIHLLRDCRDALAGLPVNVGEIAPPAPSQQREIRLLTCKQCGCFIDAGLCGYDCPCDGDVASARNRGDMEVRIYQFVRSEQPAPPQAPEHSK